MFPVTRTATGAAGAAGAVIVLALLAGAAPASAEPLITTLPVCPQARANVGIDLVSSPAFSQPDRFADASISAGALPPGVVLTGDSVAGEPWTFSGTPTTAGTYSFTVKGAYVDSAPLTIDCTMVVGALPEPVRIAGTDRYDQAARVSASIFSEAETVYLASGEKFADALSASSVAGIHGAPLLLTQSGTLPASTATELGRLKPKNVVVVGGPLTIADAVLTAVEGSTFHPTVTRISGVDRYDSSRLLIGDGTFGRPSSPLAYLADGRNFPDALAASPAAVTQNAAVLLVDGSRTALSQDDRAALDGAGVAQVTIAGGPNSVSTGVESSLSPTYNGTRVSGANRYEGAVAVNGVFTEARVAFLASGELYPDALSAGPAAGHTGNPIYLVQKGCVPTSVLDDIARIGAKEIVILGGVNTVSAEVAALKPC
ncbi:cell wall-binding repeat-containing protein [Herbiconiux sp. KACC 21604]|uniref:cell wall-binding repeat-containing protein n=1 Tax=unclassified Herbiconiux TaxID=2618217 RepID=UPI001492E85D|nr:cell wall-binding repeat-containing protein [Herbiconiux sp. SALV-R1]QJU54687.1 cell wall-binding repeat-containing protein [Herbiconiux sp. SALV-R1]WPO85790.1 cell wall-binding repeat-containing protein [Herbiconiux sp. KACC 21604]